MCDVAWTGSEFSRRSECRRKEENVDGGKMLRIGRDCMAHGLNSGGRRGRSVSVLDKVRC